MEQAGYEHMFAARLNSSCYDLWNFSSCGRTWAPSRWEVTLLALEEDQEFMEMSGLNKGDRSCVREKYYKWNFEKVK